MNAWMDGPRRMVAASVIKSALTQWGNFKLAAAFHRWQKIISTAKSQHTAQQYRVAATVRLSLLCAYLRSLALKRYINDKLTKNNND